MRGKISLVNTEGCLVAECPLAWQRASVVRFPPVSSLVLCHCDGLNVEHTPQAKVFELLAPKVRLQYWEPLKHFRSETWLVEIGH